MTALKYLAGYPEPLQAKVRDLLGRGRLGPMLAEKYPQAHAVRSDRQLYDYVQELKERHLRQSVPLARVQELEYVLTPGRYVGLPDEDEDFNFAERFAALKAEFDAQLLEEARLNAAIAVNLAKVKL